MATTKLWKFSSRLDTLIDYAINGEKTDEGYYVSGINCMPETAYCEMTNTKKQFFKTKGIECFHGYQSFDAYEVSANDAHEIGVKLAEELWGDRYQVIVTTHLNTAHVHNHFVLNSVSFVDGKRFCNTKKDYAMMRKTSDKLCYDYGLSVLKQEEKYDKFATSSIYKELMKDSIDYAIRNSKDYEEFKVTLAKLDYIVTERNGNLSIRREPYKRNTRIERQFGNEYSIQNIQKRILETQPEFHEFPETYLLVRKTREHYSNIEKYYEQNKSPLIALFLIIAKLLIPSMGNPLKENVTRITPQMIQALKQMEEYSKQARFLCKYNVHTEEQLIDFEVTTHTQLAPLKSERENLWRKHKNAKTPEEKQNIEQKIAEISKQITPLAEKLKTCKWIQMRVSQIKKDELHKELREEEKSQQVKPKKKDRGRER
ncbi:MAG: relaxase/mobilization nuclease domain-containing protein [Clostridia bacterium]|nr:relaxase/mobilization nuclease domain-containing protein [Clostridia bacterium]